MPDNDNLIIVAPAPEAQQPTTQQMGARTAAEIADLNLSPDKQLALHHKRIEIRYEKLIVQREQDHLELRELLRLRKDRFDSICNSVFSSFIIAVGTNMASTGTLPCVDFVFDGIKGAGWVIILIGVFLGIVKPPIEALLWRMKVGPAPTPTCPHCGYELANKNKC